MITVPLTVVPVTVAWPATLPLPFLDYSAAPRNATIISAEKDAVINRRSRFVRSYQGLSVTWVLNTEQHEAFKVFYGTVLCNGASCFAIELRYPANTSLKWWEARIAGGFSSQRQDGIWTVSASMDLVNPIEIEEES